MHEGEPCGSLPVTGVSVSAFYCHHHQAWSVHRQTFIEYVEGDPKVTESASMRFGPFDSIVEVQDWLARAILGLDDLLP